MSPLIIGNWKSYITDANAARLLVRGIVKKLPSNMRAAVVLAPTAPLFGVARAVYSGSRISYALQDVSTDLQEASTGSVLAQTVRGAGALYCIVGHAERRARGDTNSIVAEKVRMLLDAKVIPIVCVGEQSRDSDGAYFTAIEQDVRESLKKVLPHEAGKVVVAYEPVWAIGAKAAPAPRVVSEALVFVRKILADRFGREAARKTKVVYGGAVDALNARELLNEGNADGFLVGRSSTKAAEFLGIIKSCQR